MKKILTLFAIFIAFSFIAKAQTYLLDEGFENGLPSTWQNIDNDGDGFSWVIKSLENDDLEPHAGDKCMGSYSFDNDSQESLTPDNYLITSAIEVPAGLTSANGLRLTWWVAAQDPDYPEDYYEVLVSTTGNSVADFTAAPVYAELLTDAAWRQHTVDLSQYANGTIYIAFVHRNSTDQFMIRLDDISVFYFEEAGITCSDNTIDFGELALNASKTVQINVYSALLSGNITATCEAPFAISSNSTSFTTNQSLTGNANAVLFVRYMPTETGAHSGNITLTNGTTTATIAVSGTGVSCDEPLALPFHEDFEDALAPCWSNIDYDNDGHSWFWDNLGYGHESAGCYTSFSYNEETWEDIMPNDWLILPLLAIPSNGAHLTWWDAAYIDDWPDNSYDVLVSTTTLEPSAFTPIYHGTLTTAMFYERTVDLMDYAGQNIHIAFAHNTNTQQTEDSYGLLIDDITVEAGAGIEDIDVNSSISIYPNPASQILNIEAEGFSSYEIVNMMGQTVQTGILSNGETQVNVSTLSNGIYMVRLSNGTAMETVRVVVR